MTLLDRTIASLPAAWYYDPAQYARELEAIWYRDWICVGRARTCARPATTSSSQSATRASS